MLNSALLSAQTFFRGVARFLQQCFLANCCLPSTSFTVQDGSHCTLAADVEAEAIASNADFSSHDETPGDLRIQMASYLN